MRGTLALILLAGCGSTTGSGGGGDDRSGSAARAEPEAAASCEGRAADLAAWATAVDRTYGGGLMASDKLVEDRDASPIVLGQWRATGVTVTHDAISIDGRPVADANALAARLTEAHRRDPAGNVVLFIDRDAPTARIAIAAAGAIAAGARDVQVAVARPVPPLSPPPRSSVTDELAARATGAPSVSAAIAVADVLQRVDAECPALVRALRSPASRGATTSKAQGIIDALRPGLVECSCRIDLDALRSTLWVLLGPGPNPPAGIVQVTLAAGGDRGAAIATGATWADAAPALLAAAAGGKRVRIVAPVTR
jgi:hypothetical protein